MANTHDIQPRTARILDLPTELHLAITHHLAILPCSLFSLAKTCRALHNVYTQKCIWDTALHVLCLRDALFVPSYPIQSMTVSQLQRAVMGPDLWNSRLRAGKPFVGANVHSVGTFTQEQNIDEPVPIIFGRCKSRVYLVPGGRYLFEQAHNVISLWDLGIPLSLCKLKVDDEFREGGNEKENTAAPVLIDRLEVNKTEEPGFTEDQPPEFAVHQSADGKRLIMIDLTVYEITPSGTAPKFHQLANLAVVNSKIDFLPLGPGCISLTSNLAILHPLHHILAWDFTTGRYTLWNIWSYVNRFPPPIQFLSHNSMVLVNQANVQIWTIPPSTSMSSLPATKTIYITPLTPESDIPEAPPTFEVAYQEGKEYEPLVFTLSLWYNPLDLPILYDVISASQGSEANEEHTPGSISRYRVVRESVDTSNPSGRPLRLHRELTFPLPLNIGADKYHSLHRISGDLLFSFYSDCVEGFDFGMVYTPFCDSPYYGGNKQERERGVEDEEEDTGSSISSSSPGGSTSTSASNSYDYGVVGMNLDEIGAQSPSLTFCSASGRVICSSVDIGEDGPVETHRHSIRVYDFSEVL